MLGELIHHMRCVRSLPAPHLRCCEFQYSVPNSITKLEFKAEGTLLGASYDGKVQPGQCYSWRWSCCAKGDYRGSLWIQLVQSTAAASMTLEPLQEISGLHCYSFGFFKFFLFWHILIPDDALIYSGCEIAAFTMNCCSGSGFWPALASIWFTLPPKIHHFAILLC